MPGESRRRAAGTVGPLLPRVSPRVYFSMPPPSRLLGGSGDMKPPFFFCGESCVLNRQHPRAFTSLSGVNLLSVVTNQERDKDPPHLSFCTAEHRRVSYRSTKQRRGSSFQEIYVYTFPPPLSSRLIVSRARVGQVDLRKKQTPTMGHLPP